jgi:serine/threonine protein kinase
MEKKECRKHVEQKELAKLIENAKQPLGAGGQGQVYKMETEDGCFYAGKTSMKKGDLSLMKESSALSTFVDICGEYVLCFVGYYEVEGYIWVFTEYINDMISLFTFINAAKQINAQIVSNLIEGLKFLHGHGVAHLDIKPENILINPETNEIRYIDFGLACMSGQECEPAGTGYYLPPEIYYVDKSFKSAKQQDIWSLGVTIWVSHHGNYLFTAQEVKLNLQPLHWWEFIEYKLQQNKLLKPEYLETIGKRYKIDLNNFINLDPQKRVLKLLE